MNPKCSIRMVNEFQKSDDSEQPIDDYSLKSKKLKQQREINELSHKIRPLASLINIKTFDYKYDEEFKIKELKDNNRSASEEFEAKNGSNNHENYDYFEIKANLEIRRDVMNKNFIRAIKREWTKNFKEYLDIKNLK